MEQETLIRNIKVEINKAQDDLAGYFKNLRYQFVEIKHESSRLYKTSSAMDAPHAFRDMLKTTYQLANAKSLKNADLQSSMTAHQIEMLRAKEMIVLIDKITDYAQRYLSPQMQEMLSTLQISREIISNSSSALESTVGRIQKFRNRLESIEVVESKARQIVGI